jgi:hypothetical protein
MAGPFENRQRLFELLKKSGPSRPCSALRWEGSTQRVAISVRSALAGQLPPARALFTSASWVATTAGAVFGHFIYIVPGIQWCHRLLTPLSVVIRPGLLDVSRADSAGSRVRA